MILPAPRMIDLARIRHVVFDFDGTLSLLTGGWSDVMADVYTEHLPAAPEEDHARRRALARREILALAGKPPIHQMVRLAEMITARGGEPAAPHEYHGTFIDRLRTVVKSRREQVHSGELHAERMLVPGARSFLERLRQRGLSLTLLSGSELSVLRKETQLLGIAHFFEGRLIGPDGDSSGFTKRAALERIVSEHRLAGEELLAFGDGPIEIEQTRALGGRTVGIACREDDPEPGVPDELKGELLKAAGAEWIIADFRAAAVLFDED